MANVLVIEDDQAVAGSITFVLEEEGHKTLHTQNLSTATQLLKDETFDLVMLDAREHNLLFRRCCGEHASGFKVEIVVE